MLDDDQETCYSAKLEGPIDKSKYCPTCNEKSETRLCLKCRDVYICDVCHPDGICSYCTIQCAICFETTSRSDFLEDICTICEEHLLMINAEIIDHILSNIAITITTSTIISEELREYLKNHDIEIDDDTLI